MSVLSLLELVRAEAYWFGGACYLAGAPYRPVPLEVSCSFANDGGALSAEGTYRHQSGTTAHPFSVRVHFAEDVTPTVQVNSSHTGMLSGHIFAIGVGYELLVSSSAHGSVLSCRFEIERSGSIHSSGVVSSSHESFAFVANGAPGTNREALGNVVGILGGRRV
jgi:hypothetical protein